MPATAAGCGCHWAGPTRLGIRVPTSSTRPRPSVAPHLWGQIQLCWNRDARTHELHTAYPSAAAALTLDPDLVVAIDEGIINPMTWPPPPRRYRGHGDQRPPRPRTQTPPQHRGRSAAINGWPMHQRVPAVAALRRRTATCNHTAAAGLRNLDHQVVTQAADMIMPPTPDRSASAMSAASNATRPRRAPRAGRHQRRRLSQWSRGRRNATSPTRRCHREHITSRTPRNLPACLNINRPTGPLPVPCMPVRMHATPWAPSTS